MRGCGKSTLTHHLASDYPRKIVFDKLKEWDGTHIVRSLDEFKNIWREIFHHESYTIVVHFAFGCGVENIEVVASEIARIVYLTGMESGLETCLIYEEAQFYFPLHALSPVGFELLTTGRHARISVLWNTQRPASVNKLLVSQASQLFIGQLFEMRDVTYLTQSIGDVAQLASELPKLHFLHYQVGIRETQIVDLT